MKVTIAASLALLAIATPAVAEVKTTGPSGFEIEHRVDTALPAAELYRMLVDVPSWWSDSHTYSGKASNMRFDARVGGCWCEAMPDGGGIEHMRVAQVQPGSRILLLGSLGPLVNEATVGALSWTIEPKTSGSTLVMNYRVAGFYKGDGGKLAGIVDQVMGTQVRNLKLKADAQAARR